VDVAELSEGFSFINKNLFPAVYPEEGLRQDVRGNGLGASCGVAYGFHFLQWTSSWHDKDWHNMPLADLAIVMGRLAVLEESLLAASAELVPEAQPGGAGSVSIIKNYGRLVGGSLAHGHQQIVFSNVRPRRVWENLRFAKECGEPFPAYLWQQTPDELLIADYGEAALMVPYFMRRPYDMILTAKDSSKGYLYELSEDELEQVAQGWHDAIRAIHGLMPEMGREVAYNVVTHSGTGTGLYFEFLPYTQEYGGLEKLGLFVCQERPRTAAARIREVLEAL
jgi:galactose-1-phosphate uridylyltransferase